MARAQDHSSIYTSIPVCLVCSLDLISNLVLHPDRSYSCSLLEKRSLTRPDLPLISVTATPLTKFKGSLVIESIRPYLQSPSAAGSWSFYYCDSLLKADLYRPGWRTLTAGVKYDKVEETDLIGRPHHKLVQIWQYSLSVSHSSTNSSTP